MISLKVEKSNQCKNIFNFKGNNYIENYLQLTKLD